MFQDTALSNELIQAFMETHYRIHQVRSEVPPLTLRVGQANADLIDLHHAHGVNCSAVITAYNPHAQKVDESSNLRRQDNLKQELSSQSLVFFAAEGEHPTNGWGSEPSVLVLNLSLEAAKDIGRKYEQAAIVWNGLSGVPQLVLLR